MTDVLSVTKLSHMIKGSLESSFGSLRVRGEISNLTSASSGHFYFVLKDECAVLKAVVWQSSKVGFRLENGMRVICGGKLNIYQVRSEYQLIASTVIHDGVGALMEMLIKRRKALEAEGLFDISRKQPLNRTPATLGVVTSASGAVIEDILVRLRERFPCKVIIRDVPVQGAGAAEAIADAIQAFNRDCTQIDTIIVARGGGSIEDLWAFNEVVVVRSIAESAIPIISAVGHETDFTLADYAADVRSPTPTAAVEIATISRHDLIDDLNNFMQNIRYIMRIKLHKMHSKLSCFTHALTIFDHRLYTIDKRLSQQIARIISLINKKCDYLQNKMQLLKPNFRYIQTAYDIKKTKLSNIYRVIEACGYPAVLNRGFAIVEKEGAVVANSSTLSKDDILEIKMRDGMVKVRVI